MSQAPDMRQAPDVRLTFGAVLGGAFLSILQVLFDGPCDHRLLPFPSVYPEPWAFRRFSTLGIIRRIRHI